MTKDQAVREAAAALKTALDDAESAGFVVQWPASAAGLASIAVSQTAAILPVGQPLDLTPEERSDLPALDPNASNDPKDFISAKASKKS